MNRGIVRTIPRRGIWLLLAAVVTLPAPVLEPQPARAAATTFTVTTAEDSDDGFCGALPDDCTLREAIRVANVNAGKDTIAFNIPGDGVHTVKPTTQLPALTEAVVIDGYSQPGAQANTAAQGTNAVLRIQLDGSEMVPAVPGLIDVRGDGSVIRGLVINNFQTGIIVQTTPGVGPTLIEGNFIGVDPAGTTAKPNTMGLNVFRITATGFPPVRIGGADPAARNLISGNGTGMVLFVVNHTVQGNLIGADRSGANPLGNGLGIDIPFGEGVIEDNVVAFNSQAGIDVANGDGNRIVDNSIFSNGGAGIDLGTVGPTPNDPGDGDTGANGLQNFPVLQAATPGDGATTVTGSLNSQPNRQYLIQFFSNPNSIDPEGKTLLGEREVSTDENGNTAVSFSVDQSLDGHAITATATDVTPTEPTNTSEFSLPVTATPPPAPAPPPTTPSPPAAQGQTDQTTQNDNQSQETKKKKKARKGKKGKKGQKTRERHRLAPRTSQTPNTAGKSDDDTRDSGGKRADGKRHDREPSRRHVHHGRKNR